MAFQPLLELEHCYVLAGEEVNTDFPFGRLCVESTEGETVRIACVAEIDGRILVCVPGTAWHKKPPRRALLPGSFVRASSLEVAASLVDSRDQISEGEVIKVWLGYFTKDYAINIEAFSLEDEVDVDFDGLLIPNAEALKALAVDHFSFFSAAEGFGPREQDDSGAVGLSSRVSKLEELITEMNTNIAKLASLQPSSPPAVVMGNPKPKTSRPSALRSGPSSSPSAKVQFVRGTEADDFPDLDAGVVSAALGAGVGQDTLEEMQKLMQKNRKGAKSLKQDPAAAKVNVLSESEEESAPEEGVGSLAVTGDPMVDALTKLTSIVDHLSLKQKKNLNLDSALDGVVGFPEHSSSSSGKRAAAARRVLRMALKEQPAELYKCIESLMEEDIASQTVQPGLAAMSCSARGWVEHRSRIGSYKATAHAAWGIAGVLDCLKAGQTAAARARANLLLLQLDQSSADRGNWTLASELSLEMAPPFGALSQHVPPDLGNGEQPFSRLLDHRWAEIMMSYLRDQDDYLSRRKTLGRPKVGATTENEEGAEPKRRLRPKPKAKASAREEQ